MSNWQALFTFKCKDHDSFLSLYSKIKSTLHKLKRSNSIAVTDDVFLKEFFAKAISADELKGETKKLLKGGSETCAKILEYIHLDYRALETVELMRDSTDPSFNSLLSRRVLKEHSGKNLINVAHPMNGFSHNANNLLPRTYYLQFKD